MFVFLNEKRFKVYSSSVLFLLNNFNEGLFVKTFGTLGNLPFASVALVPIVIVCVCALGRRLCANML